jgi:membrane associated rhomboid family serine protease
MDKEERVGLGKLSLGLAIGGIFVPILIAIIGVFLEKGVGGLALLLIGASEVIALLLGIIARHNGFGKAGLIVSAVCIALVVLMILFLIPTTIEIHTTSL